ncbi:lysine-specific demethylase JMJ705-like [Triticum dicoccoides]|uniref:lysine-specific demethylase JMJ705-like n=1 Tax=Triticum dicoccoides TaxID=85692 RepID=UPI00188EF82A|nr:lysine-specific demethylase JMJ705-like [Triticum dicoccoides]
MPGSGFPPCAARPGNPQPAHVGETAWNMRAAARGPGSLLRFMREDVPGVTTPMLYVGMLFSWFAWHVEDHDLHSLNYMHLGAAKTWYGVPRDAALAFEDVVRVHGYAGEVNALEAFATLGQKTTLLSPELLVGSGVPCCRLVQNAGEFVVTFPGSYHCGFSHGFNCGEASNIATPEWWRVAKEAAVRRASINQPPMLSHYQLLYELALSMCIRDPSIGTMEPRSSRLKEKKKGEGGQLVKKLFVQNAIQDNELLSCLLNDGSSCIILPINAHDGPVLSALRSRSQLIPKSKLSRCTHDSHNAEGDKEDVISAAGLLDQGLLSCVSCGILSFSCVAVIKPRECASKYFMSSDYNSINDQLVGSGGSHLANAAGSEGTNGGILRPSFEPYANDAGPVTRNSAPDLLASAYGNQPDTDEDNRNKKIKVSHDSSELDGTKILSSSIKWQQRPSSQSSRCIGGSGISNGPRGVRTRNKYQLKMALSQGFQLKNNYWTMEQKVQPEPSRSKETVKEPLDASGADNDARCNSAAISVGDPRISTTTMDNLNKPIVKIDKDSSRMHVFCLEHAVEVEKQLQAIGGAHVILLCRPEYLKIEAEARSLAAEMEVEHGWKDIHFREANMEDRKMIEELLQDEESIPTSSDWAVKLGTNLYYSANLAKSPLHNKQIPYNRVIYRAFGCSSPDNSPVKRENCEGSQDRQKKVVLAGRWCGKAWMSNQVHPFLAQRIESSEAKEADKSSGVQASKRNSGTITDVPKSSKKRGNMAVEVTIDTKRPRLAEGHSSKPLKGIADVSHPSPAAVVPRVSSRIADRANRLKSDMTEEDDGHACRPKPKATSHSRTRPPKKIEVEAKKQMNMSKGDSKMMAPTAAKDDEEHPSATKGGPSVGPATKLEFSQRKHRTRTKTMKLLKKATGEERTPRDHPMHVEGYTCSIEGCSMSFDTRNELSLHELDICPVKGCGKKFFTHKFLLQHHKVHTETTKQLKKATGEERAPTPRDHPMRVEGYTCTIDGCSMSFDTKKELSLHERDICPVEGCGKKFFTHKYLLQHRKVHTDDRPLKCPWEGCDVAFKWAWARTEHLRVHTGDRPYVCCEPGCAETFRFVSDSSRHKRETGHSTKQTKTKT